MGVIMGTAAYMSPSRPVGFRLRTTRTDIWSFGVVLYEMLTGSGCSTVRRCLGHAGVGAQEPTPIGQLLSAANDFPGPIKPRPAAACLNKEPQRNALQTSGARVEISDGRCDTAPAESTRQSVDDCCREAASRVAAGAPVASGGWFWRLITGGLAVWNLIAALIPAGREIGSPHDVLTLGVSQPLPGIDLGSGVGGVTGRSGLSSCAVAEDSRSTVATRLTQLEGGRSR